MKKNMQKSSKTRIKFGTNLTPAQKKKTRKLVVYITVTFILGKKVILLD